MQGVTAMTARGFWDDRDLTIQERFEAFHARHPEVYAALVDLARQFARAGRMRWSIDAAFHVLRWQRHIAGLPDEAEKFKLNDHYTSRYARLLQEQEPELTGLFELRSLRAV